MEILQWCKMQVIALIILVYVGTIHIRDGANLNKITKKSNCNVCLLYTSPSPRDRTRSRMPSSA